MTIRQTNTKSNKKFRKTRSIKNVKNGGGSIFSIFKETVPSPVNTKTNKTRKQTVPSPVNTKTNKTRKQTFDFESPYKRRTPPNYAKYGSLPGTKAYREQCLKYREENKKGGKRTRRKRKNTP